ncbi:hypothetical protein ACFQL1_11045 [Halomicroarcula sp. GCM10025709]|uniref:hypothetical protein n=1 Tax=Haloarcula TaxID=2237 RepID=UPI0024C382EC|nr:hypothetical protein [Halomicroarcula sp. YJ-61-S]
MVGSDRDRRADGAVDPERYLDSVLHYLHSQGYETATNELNASAVLIACVASEVSDGPERSLCLVETAADTVIDLPHVKYLLETGKEKDIGHLALTSPGGISPDAQTAADEYGVQIISPDDLSPDAAGFGVAVEDIEFPESSPTAETEHDGTEDPNSAAAESSAADPASASSSEMAQEQASLAETLVMLLGSGLALLGLAPFVSWFSRIADQSPAIAAIVGFVVVSPPAFVAVSAVDDYLNLRLFGSWRVRKENVAGAMGAVILGFGIVLNEAASNGLYRSSDISGLVSIGGGLLLLYSATIHVVRLFFEKRRGRR